MVAATSAKNGRARCPRGVVVYSSRSRRVIRISTSSHTRRHLYRLSCFCGARCRDQQTDRHTDRLRYSVCAVGRLYAVHAMRPSNQQQKTRYNKHQIYNRYARLASSRSYMCRITNTHTHPFNGPLPRTTRLSRYQKGKTNVDFTEARDSEWQRHQQVFTLLQTDTCNHASIPPLSFLQAGCPSCRPTNSVEAVKAVCSLQKKL